MNPKDWYLPHFGVWNTNKPGKLCLNDFFYQGTGYVSSLVAVLLRFRQGKIAYTGDIKEMFHQVVIRLNRCRGDESQDPDIYEMNVMIFGAEKLNLSRTKMLRSKKPSILGL